VPASGSPARAGTPCRTSPDAEAVHTIHTTALVKLIKTIVRISQVEVVREALARLNIGGLTVRDAHESEGFQRAGTPRDPADSTALLPRVSIELIVPDDLVGEANLAILRSTYASDLRQARISVLPL
jgi:nitrogen regulatory protein PII